MSRQSYHNCKKIGIREFQRNFYKSLPKPGVPVMITNRNQASFFVCSSTDAKAMAMFDNHDKQILKNSTITGVNLIKKGEKNENNS